MQNFITALKAENIKKKGTGIYLLAAILGVISPIILGIVQLFQDKQQPGGLTYNYYSGIVEKCIDPYCGFFFPLLIIITVSRFAQLDHKNGGWQLMETQPVLKFSIYFAKFTLILFANLISILSMVAGCFLIGWLVSFFIEVPAEAVFSFEAGIITNLIFRLFIASIMLSAFQYLIAVLVPSFIWSIVIGFFGLLLNIFLLLFKVMPAWYPFEVLAKVANFKDGSDMGYWLIYSEVVGILGSVILLYIGYKWYMHKRLKWAFFSKPMRFVKLLAVLVVCGGLLAWVLQPNKMLNYSETVISGTITGEMQYKNIYMIDEFVKDTIAVIPITNGQFNKTITKEIPLNRYLLSFDGMMQQYAIMGSKDSVNLAIKTSKIQSKAVVTGTRLAENRYSGDESKNWSSISYYLEDNVFIDQPAIFTKQLVDEWKEAVGESDKFRTADNYVPKDDYLQKNRQLITIKYLNFWNEFLKKRDALYPGQKTEETADIAKMKKVVPLNDESLLTNDVYFDYLKSNLIAGNKADLDENTKTIQAIAKLPAGTFKDKMLYWQLNKSLKEASSIEERMNLVTTYSNGFTNKKFAGYINNYNTTLNNLSKGSPAPLFDAITLNNKPFSLAALKGSFVVIDVWATWCMPCKLQSPYFEKFAVKYKQYPVQFVALSTDRKIDAWFVDAKTKSQNVLQLHANDIAKFGKQYNVEGIPRFILLDKAGNFLNAEMPFPEDKTFEKLLRQELGLAEQK